MARCVQSIVVRVYRKDNQDVATRALMVDPSQGYTHPSHVDGTDLLFRLSWILPLFSNQQLSQEQREDTHSCELEHFEAVVFLEECPLDVEVIFEAAFPTPPCHPLGIASAI